MYADLLTSVASDWFGLLLPFWLETHKKPEKLEKALVASPLACMVPRSSRLGPRFYETVQVTNALHTQKLGLLSHFYNNIDL